MPRKCCTVYDGKACRSNYDETKNIPHEKVTTYSFPEDPTERELWIRSLPNILSCKITKNVSVCEKHFPPDCQRIKKPGGYLVPAVPPSIFGDTKCSLFVLTRKRIVDKYLSSVNNYCYLIVIATRLKIWLEQLIYICEVETVTELCGSF